jgi:hypothetical protein
MPRPKSDLTAGTFIGVRATLLLKEEFKRLGGATWLRRFLTQSLEKHLQEKKT